MNNNERSTAMTDDRINDVINRLEKIADRLDERCNRMTDHLDDHSKRITILETKDEQRDKPSKWGNFAQIGSVIVALIAFVVAVWRNQ